MSALAPAQQIAIGEYVSPNNTGIGGIALGPDGALWFTAGADIGRITTAGDVSAEYPVPSTYGGAWIVTGPDGALWFTEPVGARIGRVTTAGAVAEYPVPTGGQPGGIAVGPDGALWFTQYTGNKIGRITTAGVVTAEYPIPTADSGPSGIAAGPDGALWFTELSGNKIGRITTAGAIAEYLVPTANSLPDAIAAAKDALWFTEYLGNKIGRITAAGAIAEYPIPTANSNPDGIAAGADGALWFGELGHNIGRITTEGTIAEYPLPPAGPFQGLAGPITVGPEGELWFVGGSRSSIDDFIVSAIGEAFFVTAELSVSPAGGFAQTKHTFAGSGFTPNETVRIYTRGVGSPVLATAAADATGAFTVSAGGSPSPLGPRLYVGLGETSGNLGAASFAVTSNLVVFPSSGPVGNTVTAEGYGFPPFANVRVYLGEQRAYLGAAVADANGSFEGGEALTFTVPTGASPGLNGVQGAWVCVNQACPYSGFASFTVQ